MEQNIETIKQILEKSQSAGILLEENAGEDFFLAKESLKSALLMKDLPLILLPIEPPQYAQKWIPFLSANNSLVPQKITINVPKDKYPIQELKYDENDNFFSLMLTIKGEGFSKDDLILEKALPKADSIFYFSPSSNLNKVEDFKDSIELPEPEKIVFISPNEKTISEQVFDIISSLNLQTEMVKASHLATLLFASLIKETDNLTKNISKNLLQAAASLLEQGADKKTAQNILSQEKTPHFWRLLGRALARTDVDKATESSWTFLAKKDFEKSELEITPELFSQILKELNKSIASQTFSLALWQNSEEIKAIISSSDKSKLDFLASHLGIEPQNDFLETGPYRTFSEAEIQLRRVLKNSLS